MSENPNGAAGLLLKVMDTVNVEIMSDNEWQLGTAQAVVDFENMGQFPERLGGLFAAVKGGLKEAQIDLLAATLLILPYRMSSGDQTEGKVTKPLLLVWSPTREARWNSRMFGDEKRACEAGVSEACAAAGIPSTKPQGVYVMQVPYFVKPLSEQDAAGRKDFRVDDVIYKRPQLSTNTDWVDEHPIADYVQRFVFTFVLRGEERQMHSVLLGHEGSHLNHLLGAFFSWVGVAVDEVNRFQLERIASFQILRAHQVGNDLKAIFEFDRENFEIMEKAGTNQSIDAVKQIRRVLHEWREALKELEEHLTQLSQAAAYLGREREGFNWYKAFIQCLESLGARPSAADAWKYRVEGIGRWQTQSVFDLQGIKEKAKTAHIFYTRYHFSELIGNLFKNAKRIWEKKDSKTTPQTFRVAADLLNGHLSLAFANEGRQIDEPLKSKLFRLPVPKEAQATGGNGLGLWALGMSLRTYGISNPTVENIPDFGPCFTFCFPASRS